MKLLHSIIKGEGHPLLILHGFLGMADNWKTLGNRFSENGFQVHLIDQRNHGRSFHTNEFSYQLMVEDLLHYIEYHQLEEVCIIGHSMGWKTAMFFATAYPYLVSKLIIVDIAPKYYVPHHATILEGLHDVNRNAMESRSEADRVLSNYVPEFPMRQFLLKNLYWTPEKKLDFRFHLNSLTQNYEIITEVLPSHLRYPGATLFLKGGNSDYITEEDEPNIKIHFPEAVIDEIAAAGHWIHADQPNAFFERVLTFLQT